MNLHIVLWIALLTLLWIIACGSSGSATKTIGVPTQTAIATQATYPEDTALPTSTDAPKLTNTVAPDDAPAGISDAIPVGSVIQGANLRAGPGTNYDIVGGLTAGDPVNIIGQTDDGEWYQIELASGTTAWIASFLVSTEAGAIPIVQPDTIPATPVPATNTPAGTSTAVATNTPAPTPTPQQQAVCDCSYDRYNCSDFSTHAAAQACFDYCRSIGRGDIHKLDGSDGDGLACESLP